MAMNKLKQEIIEAAIGEIEEPQMDTIKQRYRFGRDFIGFAGHFPGNPILPAFVQILLGMTVVEKHKGCRLEMASVEKAKFLIPLLPEKEIEVECRQRSMDELWSHDVRLSVSEGLAASYRIAFSAREDGK
jgi:3-hydroxyacyl-[acyl-carrier-protein] dehydratase